MDRLKFHLATTLAALCASYISAFTAVLVINNAFFSAASAQAAPARSSSYESKAQALPSVDSIVASTFFEKSDIDESEFEEEVEEARVTDLTLLGTVTGPRSIARAVIQKKGAAAAEIFKTGAEAYGYTIIRIKETTVDLKSGDTTVILDMYPPDKKQESSPSATTQSSSVESRVAKTISRASLIQDLGNNMDNMLRGIRAGPYRENGQVVGYQLKTVSSQNILYKFGLRSGDILRRINGHPITSTSKLFELWQSFPKESRVIIDIQRRNEFKTFDFTIND